MAYMRSPHYVYGDGEGIHIYDLTGGAVYLDMPSWDALAIMHVARLAEEDRLESAVDEARKLALGNLGGDALVKALGLPSVMEIVRESMASRDAGS